VTIERMDHVGVVVADIDEAVRFFVELGLELEGQARVGGEWVDRVIGLEGVDARIAMLRTPDRNGRVELSQFRSPSATGAGEAAPANALGIRHLSFAVDDLDGSLARLRTRGGELVGEVVRYENSYRLC
jgi:catechol 2,3-dioxygenase-like lactoylglutathione lyase family enzyme